MNLLYQSAFAEALGWSLVDSFWKTGVLWMLYILITSNGKRFSAAARYLLAVSALSIATIWFIAGIVGNYQNLIHGKQIQSIGYYLKDHLFYSVPVAGLFDSIFPLISSVYLSVVAFLAFRFGYLFIKSDVGNHRLISPPDDYIINAVDHLVSHLGISKKIRVWVTEKTQSAMTFGFIKPVILLPFAVLNQLSISQLEAIIAHELIHIRRNDYLVNILMSIGGLILFFNPFASILQNIIKKEREHACDDAVLELGYNSWEYAESLYLLSTTARVRNSFALGISGDNKFMLLNRVKRMLKGEPARPSIIKPLFFLLLSFLLAITFKKEKRVVVETRTTVVKVTFYQSPVIPPVVSEKPVIIFETHAKTIKVPVALRLQKLPPLPPPPPDVEEVSTSNEQASVTETEAGNHSFVSGQPQQIEFTIIETKPVVPSNNNPANVGPYLPASTFYYPEYRDSIPVKKKTVNI